MTFVSEVTGGGMRRGENGSDPRTVFGNLIFGKLILKADPPFLLKKYLNDKQFVDPPIPPPRDLGYRVIPNNNPSNYP